MTARKNIMVIAEKLLDQAMVNTFSIEITAEKKTMTNTV